jgi:hypothetical protein
MGRWGDKEDKEDKETQSRGAGEQRSKGEKLITNDN